MALRIIGGGDSVGSAPVSVAPFTPLSVAGAVAWFDMQDPASFTQAGTVTSITNKASGAAWTEATNPPGYLATGLVGLPCMDFNGTNNRIISTEAAVFAPLTNALAFTLFFVASFNTIDRGEYVFGVGNSGQAANSVRGYGQSTSSTGRWLADATNDAGSVLTATGTVQSDSSKHIFCWHGPGTTVSLNVDNGSANPSGAAFNPGTLTPNRSALGCRPRTAPNAFFDGQLGELVLYNVELAAPDMTAVFNYLANKWP